MISHDVLAAYAADAAREVDGVVDLVDGPRRHRGVRVTEDEGAFALEVHVARRLGRARARVGAAVQRRVAEYLRAHGEGLRDGRRRGRRRRCAVPLR